MSQDGSQPGDATTGLVAALVAFLVVATAVCGGGYTVYRQIISGKLPDPSGLSRPFSAALPTATQAPTTGSPPAPTGPTADPVRSAVAPTRPSTVSATLVPTVTLRPSPHPATVASATPEATSPPSVTPTSPGYDWAVEYLGCETPGASALKGRVLDRDGQVVYGAKVSITLDGWPYDLPALSNEAGWYEFYLDDGLRAQIARLLVGGEEVRLGGDVDLEFRVRPDCFQRVDLRER